MGRITKEGKWDKRYKRDNMPMTPQMQAWILKIALFFLLGWAVEGSICAIIDINDSSPIITLMVGFPILVCNVRKHFRLPILILMHGDNKEHAIAQHKKECKIIYIATIIIYIIIYWWLRDVL